MNEVLPHKDRRTGLIIFGILQMMLGILIGGAVPFMFLGEVTQAHKNGTAVDFRSLLFPVVWFGFLALVLICLGLGSIRARRWARALSLIFSWGVLVEMTLVLIATAPLWLEGLVRISNAPDVSRKGMMVVAAAASLGFYVLLFIGIPAIGILFYGSRNVQATCEANSPASWTDACPLPVLAVSVLTTVAITVFWWAYASHAVFSRAPLSGSLAPLIVGLVVSVLWLYSAWSMYRLAARGWWIQVISIGFLVLMALIGLLTVLGKNVDSSGAAFSSPLLFVLVPCVLWLGYLLWIKKYFRKEEPVR
jgi:hypothetical protein